MNKRILYITSDPWWDTDVTIIPQLSQDNDLHVNVLSLVDENSNKYRTKTVPVGVFLHEYKTMRSIKDIRYILFSLWYALKLIILNRRYDYTIWILDSNIIYSFILALFCDKKKTIVSMHNYLEHTGTKRWLSLAKKIIISQIKLFHFHSKRQESIFKNDYPNKHTFSTEMTPKGFGLPSRSFDTHTPKIFLFFGFICDYKRLDMFIKSSNKYYEKADFIIAGNCQDWSRYKKLIDKRNSIKCDIRFIANEEIPDLFSSASFIVLPYDDATQSGPLLTAYYYNLPIIASDGDYFRNMISDKKDGFLFETGNQDALNEAISKCINLDEKEYVEMKKNLHRRVETYTQNADFSRYFVEFINSIQ